MIDDYGQTKRSFDSIIYISTKDRNSVLDDFGNRKFLKPKKIFCFVSTLDGYADVTVYGENVNKTYKTLLDAKKFTNVFHEGDKAYLEEATPENESVHGCNANYVIDSVRKQNKKICIYFKKIDKG